MSGMMTGPMEEHWAPEQLAPQPCFLSSFWLLVVSGLAAFAPLASFLSSHYLCKRPSWLICLPGLQQGCAGSHVAFSPCSGTIPTSCKTRDSLRSQGPPTLLQLQWPAFLCWRNEFASATQLVTGCSTRNWKKKPKISYFDLLLLKKFCIPCQDPPEHKKHNPRVCLKSKPRLNSSRSQSQTRSTNQNQMCCSIPRKSSFQIKM